MKFNPCTSNSAGALILPAMRAFGLLAIVALQMPCSSAAASVDGQLTRVGADDVGKNSVLAKAALAAGKKTYGENCMDCRGRDFNDVVGTHAPDLGDRATPYGGNHADSGPNEILMIAGGVSFSAVVWIFLLGFWGSRERVGSAD
jgi:cytochrome c5